MKSKENISQGFTDKFFRAMLRQSEVDYIKSFSLNVSFDLKIRITGVKEIKSIDSNFVLLECKDYIVEISGVDLQLDTLLPYEATVSGIISGVAFTKI